MRVDPGEDDLHRHRLLVLFRFLLALPHIVWVTLWGVATVLVALIGWIAALFTGRLPAWAHRFLARFVRYAAHLAGFLYLTTGPFPGSWAPRAAPR